MINKIQTAKKRYEAKEDLERPRLENFIVDDSKIDKNLKKEFDDLIACGYSFKRFGIGFNIDKYHMDIDLVFFWVGIEW